MQDSTVFSLFTVLFWYVVLSHDLTVFFHISHYFSCLWVQYIESVYVWLLFKFHSANHLFFSYIETKIILCLKKFGFDGGEVMMEENCFVVCFYCF